MDGLNRLRMYLSKRIQRPLVNIYCFQRFQWCKYRYVKIQNWFSPNVGKRKSRYNNYTFTITLTVSMSPFYGYQILKKYFRRFVGTFPPCYTNAHGTKDIQCLSAMFILLVHGVMYAQLRRKTSLVPKDTRSLMCRVGYNETRTYAIKIHIPIRNALILLPFIYSYQGKIYSGSRKIDNLNHPIVILL